MIDRLAAFIVGEGNWLPLAMGAGLLAAAWLPYAIRGSSVPRHNRILAMMNLFTGVMLLVMGSGHLLAVTTKSLLGTLSGEPFVFYAIGIAIVVPASLIVRHTRTILARRDDEGRLTMRLNAWMVITLAILGIVNLPLAVPALCSIGYSRHRRPAVGWAIVVIAIVAGAGLLIGGLIFMASGQSFEEFSGPP